MSVAHDLIDALWHFIENDAGVDGADIVEHAKSTERFFALRERVRAFPDDVRKEFDEASSRFVSLSSWKLHRKMYAVLVAVRPPHKDTANVGDVVCVEVPDNCTIHDADARRLERILGLANQIGRALRETPMLRLAVLSPLSLWPEGRSVLHELAQLTRPQ